MMQAELAPSGRNIYDVMIAALVVLVPAATTLGTWVASRGRAVQREKKLDAQAEHLDQQDRKLDEVHVMVNSQRTELERVNTELKRVNQLLRDALKAAGIAQPAGSEGTA